MSRRGKKQKKIEIKEESNINNNVEIKDDDFFCDDVKLSREQLFEIRCSHLERENLQRDMKNLYTELQLKDREKELMNLRLSDLKTKLVIKDRDHKEVIESIGRKLGVSLLDSQINFETGKVTFS